jgi:hypothetical protein
MAKKVGKGNRRVPKTVLRLRRLSLRRRGFFLVVMPKYRDDRTRPPRGRACSGGREG